MLFMALAAFKLFKGWGTLILTASLLTCSYSAVQKIPHFPQVEKMVTILHKYSDMSIGARTIEGKNNVCFAKAGLGFSIGVCKQVGAPSNAGNESWRQHFVGRWSITILQTCELAWRKNGIGSSLPKLCCFSEISGRKKKLFCDPPKVH